MKALSIAILAAGCGAPAVPGGPASLPSAGGEHGGDEVVATVDGREIRASQVRAQAQSTGATARAAVEALIDAELAAAEAERRGLAGAPEVRETAEREMVRRFLESGFEREVGEGAVTEADLRRAYQQSLGRLVHPELVRVRHILAHPLKGDGEARRAELRARAERVAERAQRVHSSAEFEALAAELSDDGVLLKPELVVTAREGWTVKPFADAAFALTHPGDVSGVVESEFGYHVIYLEEHIAAENITYEEALPKLREGLWPNVRRREFGRFVDGLLAKHQTEVHPELFEEQREGGEVKREKPEEKKP